MEVTKKEILLIGRDDFFEGESAAALIKALGDAGARVLMPDCAGLPELLEEYPDADGAVLDWETMGEELSKSADGLPESLPFFALAPKEEAKRLSGAGISEKLGLNIVFTAFPARNPRKTAHLMLHDCERYKRTLLPPFTRALFGFARAHKNTFCTTGHLLGSAYRHHAMGKAYYDFYGENVFLVDTSMSVPDMGSLLEHTGPHKDAEAIIARAYGADRSLIVTNGTSTANKIVGMSCISRGDTVLIDRNCHKSITQLLMMCDVRPIYMRPTRNAFGMIGGIPRDEFSYESIKAKVDAAGIDWPSYAVISDSTYDGLLYDCDWIKENLPVEKIHFDSAWSPYAPFSPIYKGKYGMSGERTPGKTIYETHSAHKMLPCFAQASYVHVKGNYDAALLDEAYMMHTTTSANYPIVASAELASAMMDSNQGRRLLRNSVDMAMSFRREMQRRSESADGWHFRCWQPDDLSQAHCWPIEQGESWHGFRTASGLNYLDPIRVTILTPGMDEHGNMSDTGIPAAVVSHYLHCHGVCPEKSAPYHLLFLFSPGVDGKRVAALLKGLDDFKRAYDEDEPIRTAIPPIYALDPVFYMDMTLQQLSRGLHRLMRKSRLAHLMYHAYDNLPQAECTPYEAYQRNLRGEIEIVPLSEIMGRTTAEMLLPYPPGVPLVMPGEKVTEECASCLEYLEMLADIGRHYPGFETEIHGTHLIDGEYCVRVLK